MWPGGFVLVAALVASSADPSAGAADGAPAAGVTVQAVAYAPQRSVGEVTLELTPRWEDTALVVQVRANTHSVDLGSLDLEALARLVVGDEEIAPIETGRLRGHHGETTLVFRLKTRPRAFAIRIRDVPDVPVRVFRWPAQGGAGSPT